MSIKSGICYSVLWIRITYCILYLCLPQAQQSPSLMKRALMRKTEAGVKNPELSDRSSDENTMGESLQTTVGFLANEFLVRDLLHVIKDSLTDLNAAHYETASKPVSTLFNYMYKEIFYHVFSNTDVLRLYLNSNTNVGEFYCFLYTQFASFLSTPLTERKRYHVTNFGKHMRHRVYAVCIIASMPTCVIESLPVW